MWMKLSRETKALILALKSPPESSTKGNINLYFVTYLYLDILVIIMIRTLLHKLMTHPVTAIPPS